MDKHYTNTLYLVRHGENFANLTKEFSYKLVNYSLTPKGVLQAQQTAEFFKNIHIDEIYSSPLKRARETADTIAQYHHHLPVIIREEFREVNVGNLEGQPPTPENWTFHNSIINDWYQGDLTATFPGGENLSMLIERMRSGLLAITRNKIHQQIIVVGHGGIFTATVRAICANADMGTVLQSTIHNCSITEIELTTTNNNVKGTLRSWGACDHLTGEAAQLVPAIFQAEAAD
jgi:broad specificity phosphatase PhoE